MFKLGSEAYEQAQVVQWLRLNNYDFSAIPLDTFTSFKQKTKLKLLGVNPGLSDLLIKLKTKDALLFLEMKKSKGKKGGLNGSKISSHQLKWQKIVNTVPGCQYEFAHGFNEAITIIQELEN